ncbi:uncharacterized protein N7503_006948 [Penicillium pulvis]|uniref:uncharacterized protein n=1 Tax=Penicillium pulvis TaxID=1562058 RepID=UPI0025487CFD|nr:uncharacterized protein N7503_006948 [Penicillium pulvis]KAJ5797652.1 hypothetical protein N7503_006948 [Penicillium pulvis]
MTSSTSKGHLNITHIGTATAIFEIDDAILLSHTNHLDERGCQLFHDRYVFTTVDDATKLSLRPAVCGTKPCMTVWVCLQGETIGITAIPRQHSRSGEYTVSF